MKGEKGLPKDSLEVEISPTTSGTQQRTRRKDIVVPGGENTNRARSVRRESGPAISSILTGVSRKKQWTSRTNLRVPQRHSVPRHAFSASTLTAIKSVAKKGTYMSFHVARPSEALFIQVRVTHTSKGESFLSTPATLQCVFIAHFAVAFPSFGIMTPP